MGICGWNIKGMLLCKLIENMYLWPRNEFPRELLMFGGIQFMKTVYIICTNHMDLIWRRCFKDHFYYQGSVIRPYSDLQESLFNRWIDIIWNSDAIYEIEQTLTIKEYLERNPDKVKIFKHFVQRGKIKIAGGGETIIDYNMVDGEAIVRNHLYSILWCRDFLGITPDEGIAHDTFGLSAQLPQIYNKLGYKALIGYDRVFKNSKPFWKGLNGDIIYFKQDYTDRGVKKYSFGNTIKLAACTVCRGEGCRSCDYKGIDYSLARISSYDRLEKIFTDIQESNEKEFTLIIGSEESLHGNDLPEYIKMYSNKYGIDVEYATTWDITKKLGSGYLKILRKNRINQDDIDERVEGNPICTGCYITRIEMKKLNRKLEDLLLSCEKFAVFASNMGLTYPRKKIERLWSLMSLLQFHDSITSSHGDACYEELKKCCRNIALGAGQIYIEAMKTIEKNINVPDKPGYKSFVLFNPLNWQVGNMVFEAVLNVDKDRIVDGITIEDNCSNLQQVIDIKKVNNHWDGNLMVRFKGASLPPMGYKVFYYKFEGTTSVLKQTQATSIENEFYRIDIDSSVTGIYDKELGEYIMKGNVGDLVIEQDIGSPWETLTKPTFEESLSTPYFIDTVVDPEHSSSIKVLESCGRKVINITGSYINPVRKINKVIWNQEITLYDGIKKIFFKTDIDWDAANNRVSISFPLSFKTPDDEAFYEIPYGILKRKAYRGVFGEHAQPNGDWPALNFMACRNEEKDYCVMLLNKGLPCHQVKNGVILLSILRSPDVLVWALDIEGSKDKGRHTFEYAVTSNKGGLREGLAVQQGKEFNTEFMSCEAQSKEALLKTEYCFVRNTNNSVIISAIKRAEYDDSIIIRTYEAYGEDAIDTLKLFEDMEGSETNLLEEESGKAADIQFSYRPYEIKTVKFT
jgi:alpha-mannosidase